MKREKIAIGCDHGGFCLKNQATAFLKKLGNERPGFGAFFARIRGYIARYRL